ncbi:MAG: hypothetical protein ACRDMV_12535 [Streptosporangiales bacterium]
MRLLAAVGRFWYDFIIGDDWKIAVTVVAALLVTVAVLLATPLDDALVAVVAGVLLLGGFALSVAVDVRRHR